MGLSEILQIIFSGIVTISTVFYVLLTSKLVSETRSLREFQQTPDVNVYFEYSETNPTFRYIVFMNSGFGTAQNVKFKIIRDFKYYSDKTFMIDHLGIIKNGIQNFYPSQKYKFLFTDLSQNYDIQINDGLIIQISFASILNKKFVKIFNLSLSELAGNGIMTPPDDYIGRISYELKEIRKVLIDSQKNKSK